MIRKYILLSCITVCVLLLGIFSGCSRDKDETPLGPNPGFTPATLSAVPDSGVASSLVVVSGVTGAPSSYDSYSVSIGGARAAFDILPDGSFSVSLPLFLDSTNWSAPPAGPLTIEIVKDGTVIGRDTGAVRVLPLPEAPGSAEEVLRSLESIAGSVENLLLTLPAYNDSVMIVRRAAIETMQALLYDGEGSLAAVFDGTTVYYDGSMYDLKLLNALLASTGILDTYKELAALMVPLQDTTLKAYRTAGGLICIGSADDELLACGMQAHEIVKNWTNMVLKPTISDWNWLISLPLQAAFIKEDELEAISPLAVTSAVLNIMQFMLDKQIPSLFPSQVTGMDFSLLDTIIEVDEYTSSLIVLHVTNTPQQVEIADVINIILAGKGLKGAGAAEKAIVKDIVEAIADFFLDFYANIVQALELEFPGSSVNFGLFKSPLIVYPAAVITNPDLMELYSMESDIAIGDESQFEWLGLSEGKTTIQARGRAFGTRSKMVNDHVICIGCVHSSNAFGAYQPVSENRSLTVGGVGDLAIEIDGLPDGTDADVLVVYPDGITFKHLRETDTLFETETGEYRIDANDVVDGNDYVYINDPASQRVEVKHRVTTTTEITYERKFGNLLLVIRGLPAGADADIDISGPNGYNEHVVAEGLIDALVKGDYTIAAHPIMDAGETLSPDPGSQTVAVIGGETATATVAYGGGVSLDVFVGYRPTSSPSTRWIAKALSVSNIYNAPVILRDSLVMESLIPGDCGPSGPSGVGTYQLSANTTYSSGTVSGTISKVSKDVVSITVSAAGSATFPEPDGLGATGCGTFFASPGHVVLDISNPSGNPVEVEFAWGYTGAKAGVSGWQAQMIITNPYPCVGNGFSTYLFYITHNGDEPLSGSRIITVSGTNPQIGLGFLFEACGNSGRESADVYTGSASIDGSFLVSVRPAPAR